MPDCRAALDQAFTDATTRCVLSRPLAGNAYRKAVLKRLDGRFVLEQHTKTQVFHEHMEAAQARAYLEAALGSAFGQLHAWDGAYAYDLRISAKGKVLFSRKAEVHAPPPQAGHDRVKNYLLPEGEVVPPLVDMGVMTPEGRIVRSMYDKYKQINRFLELLDDAVRELEPSGQLTIVDFGCGKSYLTFVAYDYFTRLKQMPVRMIGLDLKEDVIRRCETTARKYGYEGLSFRIGDIRTFAHEGPVDVVLSLHACDTATDYALYHAVQWQARLIFSVPCCQHELNGQMQGEALALMTRYGIVKERFAALMTDALRANLLECHGYKAQLVEFVDLSHTPKNLLIRAVRTHRPRAAVERARREVEEATAQFHLAPTLCRLLSGAPR